MRHVVHAIVLRELKTRFGEYRLGALWLVLEPVAHLMVWVTIMGSLGRHAAPGVEYPVFLVLGLLPWLFVSSCVGRGLPAVESNLGLFVYRRVKPVDVVVARVAIEFVALFFVGGCFWFLGWLMGFQVAVNDGLLFAGGLFVVFVFAFALALATAVLGVVVPSSKRVVPLVMRPLYFMSAIMYPLSALPLRYRDWIGWNPVLHLVELLRGAWIGPAYRPVLVSWWYLLAVVLVVLAMSLWFYLVNERRLVTTV